MRSWRQAWQQAIDIENPHRERLYDIYRDVEVDLHLCGCVDQRKGFVQKKGFKLVDAKGKQNDDVTRLLKRYGSRTWSVISWIPATGVIRLSSWGTW